MRDQYFTDARDFIKYELLLDLAELTEPRQIASILMLTPNDDSFEGNVTMGCEPGLRRADLYSFLDACRASGRRKVSRLREFMSASCRRRVKTEHLSPVQN